MFRIAKGHRFCKMSSKALDEIIKFTFTRSTHYYRVADLLIDNQNNILQVRSALYTITRTGLCRELTT